MKKIKRNLLKPELTPVYQMRTVKKANGSPVPEVNSTTTDSFATIIWTNSF
ncbi:hypothetical protein [Pedobacter cryoconitis]|uniref:Uncharacterized protein n=1 Tax=Pedobacter cryoconitis TaxID=188932 RepID=A0A327T1N0_9SPHI|nr:hypothetical protein [Pedobacter cryoconitis]RAJ35550.1 hypothetical protein LY11_00795 [Pedobacter cryoconitis]